MHQMTSPHRREILRQILEGKRVWSYAEIGRDFDVFKREVVLPLRELKHAGIIGKLSEVEAPVRGSVQITAVEVGGTINHPANSRDDED
jgi:hypothetical protein